MFDQIRPGGWLLIKRERLEVASRESQSANEGFLLLVQM